METKIIETEGGGNWGKFMVARFTEPEWAYPSALPAAEGARPLARWQPSTLLVLDLATGEGALFVPGGVPEYDLDKHAIWVCPMFPRFLAWLYEQDTRDLEALPSLVSIPNHEFSFPGRRYPGPSCTCGPADTHEHAHTRTLLSKTSHAAGCPIHCDCSTDG